MGQGHSFRFVAPALAAGVAALVACSSTGPGEHADFVYAPCTLPIKLVAIQDGTTGPWTPLLPSNGKYYVSYTQPTGGLLLVEGNPNPFSSIRLIFGTRSELANFATYDCANRDLGPPLPYPEYNVTLKAYPAPTFAVVTMGGSGGVTYLSADTIIRVSAGDNPTDLLAVLNGIPYVNNYALKLILRRGINPAAVAPIDFASSEAFVPVKPALSIVGIPPYTLWNEYFRTAAGTELDLHGVSSAAESPTHYPAIPASRMQGGDLYRFAADVGYSGVILLRRQMSFYWHDPVDKSFAFPPLANPPTVSFVSLQPYVRFRMQFTIPQGTNGYVAAAYNGASIRATTAYLGTNAVDLTFPDFTGLSGWYNSWAPQGGTQGYWAFVLNSYPPGMPVFGSNFKDGGGYESDEWDSSVTPNTGVQVP